MLLNYSTPDNVNSYINFMFYWDSFLRLPNQIQRYLARLPAPFLDKIHSLPGSPLYNLRTAWG